MPLTGVSYPWRDNLLAGLFRRFLFTRYQGRSKLGNLALGLIQGLAMPDRAFARPFKLIVEPAGLCNLACPLCPTGRVADGRAVKIMPLALLRRAVDELGPWLYEVWLYNWGEPLLNPELFKMIAYCAERNIRTVVSSNLNLFQPGMAPGLVDSGLDTLIASIDGAEQESYGRYRRKGDFGRALAGLRAIAVERGRRGLKRPRLVWQFIVFGHNEHEMEKAAALAESAGADEIRFISSFANMERLTGTSAAQKLKELAGYLPGDRRFHLYAPDAGKRPAKPTRCAYLWGQMSLRADGGVAPCCGSYHRKDDFGSVKERGILDVWNNANYRRARRALRSGGHARSGTICDDCLKNCP